jgi:hypothetical protein
MAFQCRLDGSERSAFEMNSIDHVKFNLLNWKLVLPDITITQMAQAIIFIVSRATFWC